MLYLDRDYAIRNVRPDDEGPWLHGIVMGAHFWERGGQRRAGRTLVVSTSKGIVGRLEKGLHRDLTLRQDRGKIWLERQDDRRMYVLLSSKSTERGCNSDELWARGVVGTIRVPREQNPNFVARIPAACRKYGSRHDWSEAIVNIKVGEAFSLTWATRDGRQSWSRIIYAVAPDVILDTPRAKLHEACRELGIVSMSLPFTNWRDGETDESQIDRSEWRKV